MKFLGQLVDENGVRPDPEIVQAIIMQMKYPTSVSELRRFLGMVNQQSKFSPHLADQTKPLREGSFNLEKPPESIREIETISEVE